MGLLLAILPIAVVAVVGGAIVVWALVDDDEVTEQRAEGQATEALQQLTAKPLVMFQPMAWSAELHRMPLEDLVTQLEQELIQRRREAAAYAESLQDRRDSAS